MIPMRVCSDRQDEIERRGRCEEAIMPSADTFPPRRQIGPRLVIAGETKAHRDDSDKGFVVENIARNAHPAAQALAGPVAVGHSAIVDAEARGLARNQHLGLLAHAQHGFDAMREMLSAEAAGADFGEQARKALTLLTHRQIGALWGQC